jgi:hypothetical protein
MSEVSVQRGPGQRRPHLDLTGQPNDQRIAVAYVRSPEGEIYDFEVLEEEMAAYAKGELVAVGSEMIGWELILLLGDTHHVIRIMGRETLPSFASNGAPISVYALAAIGKDDTALNICPGKPPGAAAVTILQGETYDAQSKTIDMVGPQWITLACADEAIFKVKRLGYGPRGNQGPGGAPATPSQRTATLKMVTADYCGTGHSFTADKTKVNWRNATGTVSTGDNKLYVQYEALWTAKGAVCLDKPRHVPAYEVAKYCQLPPCKQFISSWWKSYGWQTLVTLF